MRSSRAVVLFVALSLAALAAAANEVTIVVKFHGQPLKGLPLAYLDGDSWNTTVTDDAGRATITVAANPDALSLATDCGETPCDFVLRNIHAGAHTVTADAVHSQAWLVRSNPRICDQLARVEDLVRGGLAITSAEEYNEWYSGLSTKTISDCRTLTALQERTHSLAPWYFYEFRGLPQNCDGDNLIAELDWTRWYRDLLEKETGAHPGKCVAAWDRWWRSQGYLPVPTPADRRRLEMDGR